MSDRSPELLAENARLRRQLRHTRELLEASLRARPHRQRAVSDTQLLIQLDDHFRGRVFASSDAAVAKALQAVLEAAGVPTPEQLGRRLAALASRQTGRLHVSRIGRDKTGVLWTIREGDDERQHRHHDG